MKNQLRKISKWFSFLVNLETFHRNEAWDFFFSPSMRTLRINLSHTGSRHQTLSFVESGLNVSIKIILLLWKKKENQKNECRRIKSENMAVNVLCV